MHECVETSGDPKVHDYAGAAAAAVSHKVTIDSYNLSKKVSKSLIYSVFHISAYPTKKYRTKQTS